MHSLNLALPDAFPFRDIVSSITNNAMHYRELFYNQVDDHIAAFLENPNDPLADNESSRLFNQTITNFLNSINISAPILRTEDDVDILHALNIERQNQVLGQELEAETTMAPTDDAEVQTTNQVLQLPKQLLRKYRIYLSPSPSVPPLSLRSIDADHVGSLVKIRGIITRVTQVKPLIEVASYTCDICNHEMFQVITDRQSFMPLTKCNSPTCISNRLKGILQLQSRGSKFIKFQFARIQEIGIDVPMGSVPRTLPVHLTGDLIRSVSPGDFITLSGVYLIKPIKPSFYKSGPRLSNLVSDTYIEAMQVTQNKETYKSIDLTSSLKTSFEKLAGVDSPDPDAGRRMYEKIASSISPEIFGHNDIKKALILVLVGGVSSEIANDNVKLRGDMHICLMGDPGTAKSQLLRSVCQIAPRSVYTTGKGSSGVGLTAAVIRDPHTQELILEGGALVLADTGICCIDEFDKMDEYERTSIHEVMEQQTVSISKAGITTTLNARTSVIAAANPIRSRWDSSISIAKNVNMPASLLSRFDLLFIIIDKPHPTKDYELAQHVTQVHTQFQNQEEEEDNTFTPAGLSTSSGPDISIFDDPTMVRAYIAYAKTFSPTVPRNLASYITAAYTAMRSEDAATGSGTSGYTTPRTLMAILRLSQARARLRLSNMISTADIDEATRLIYTSQGI